MFFENIVDKQLNKPLNYEIEVENLCDGIIIAKKLLKKLNC